ncbi:TVP38/TMEM64 family protein [Falsibacillus pallidus]|uniref:TVP38/TMEM64 family protein n=1 Tax=Falsibacillus pallidus TaxID=493781 RepID=UPI003D98F3E8
MINHLTAFLIHHREFAIIISIAISTLISIIGFLPSAFFTAVNISVFGFSMGLWISFLGESIGAIVAFYLYRKGFRKFTHEKLNEYERVKPLLTVTGKQAFFLVLSLRIMPFVPSGIVTFAAAVGMMSGLDFFIASTIGKIPAMLLEAYSVNELMNWTGQGKIILAAGSVVLLLYVWKKMRSS